MADPLDRYAIATKIARAAWKEQKSDELEIAYARTQFEGALYLSDTLGVCIPTDIIDACISKAARKLYKSQYIRGGYLVTGVDSEASVVNDAEVKLRYPGEQDPKRLFDHPEFRFRKSVVIDDSRIAKVRPCFHGWSIHFQLIIQPEFVANLELFEEIMVFAGRFYGLGDWITKYGKFTVTIDSVNGAALNAETGLEEEALV